jgi:hypothetical protein
MRKWLWTVILLLLIGLMSCDSPVPMKKTTKKGSQSNWKQSEMFEAGGYTMIGEKDRIGIIYDGSEVLRFYPDKEQKYMWHFWGKSEEFTNEFKIVAFREGSDEKLVISDMQLAGPNNTADQHSPSMMSLPKPGLWKLEVYFDGKTKPFGSVVVEVHDKKEQVSAERDCEEAIIEQIDFLKLNGITYSAEFGQSNTEISLNKGKKIGEVAFNVMGKICKESRNGDASFLPVGTPIYEVKGYNSSFRVIASGKIYDVHENPHASSIRELYDIEGKVKKVSFASTWDGSHIKDLSEKGSSMFINEFLSLPYVGFDEVYKKSNGFDDRNRIFLTVHLKDGTSLRISYWMDENSLTPGAFGTEKLKEIILNENPPWDRIKEKEPQ